MKKTTRLISIIIALLMLTILVACTEGKDKVTEATDEGTESKDGTYVADYLPDEKFGGKKFRVGVFVEKSFDISIEDTTNVVSEAVYKRNLLLEERYDIEFEEIVIAPTYDEAFYKYKDLNTAGEDAYEICKQIMRNAWIASVEGMVVPVDNLDYCDPTQEWYLKYVNDALEVDGTLFYAYTYEADTVTRAIMAIFFNKKILEDKNIEDPYQIVTNGTWTIEKMHQMAAAAINDVNGDGIWKIDNDVYGIITEDDMYTPSMWIGSGLKMIGKDESTGLPYFAVGKKNEKFINVLNTCYKYYNQNAVVFEGFTQRGQTVQTILDDVKSFTEDHSLFYIGGIYQSESMTNMNSDFGILPLPKYDEKQDTYYTRVCDGHANCVPTTNKDLRFTSIILEDLAVESLNLWVPAYFENAIENRYLRDPEKSLEIIRMMQANTVLDLGDSVWMSSVRSIVIDCFRNNRSTFSSTFSAYAPMINKSIANDLEKMSLAIENFQ